MNRTLRYPLSQFLYVSALALICLQPRQGRAQPTTNASTQAAVAVPNADPRLPSDSLTATAVQQRIEIQVLRARLEEEKSHNAAVLQTVYWSLGVLVTISVALIGFGWFANFRVYERDKAALAESLRGEAKSQLAAGEAELSTRFDALRSSLADSIDRARAENRAQAEKAVEAYTETFTRKLATLERRLFDLTLDHLVHNAQFLFTQDQHGNGFHSYSSAVLMADSAERSGTVNRLLNDLEKKITAMDGIFGSDINDISQMLNTVRHADPVQVERLRELLRTVKKL